MKKNHAKLMRVNHSGEICAQALYRGQLLFNKDKVIEKNLQKLNALSNEKISINNFNLALKYDPNNSDVYNNLGLLFGCVSI